MQLDRQTFQDRLNEGKAAYEEGDPSDSCPYNRYGNAEEQFGHRYWTRGWKMARSAAESQQSPTAASTGQ
ncbi:ribosome modulation factor [Streptomyces phage Gilgamesh]|uniref:Ribosome modulation factor n=1 Tax=Streptomyces phage Gilgamesh TaxID=2599890 RepID=A0A5J6TR15_9CAUD|nr:ribosome modulation factor [Streptomyces phage Gilgamesh]QFG13243.1 ribosome modulation factor [Streptomyces phage Gilgamesh]